MSAKGKHGLVEAIIQADPGDAAVVAEVVENTVGATPVQPPITELHAAVRVWLPRS